MSIDGALAGIKVLDFSTLLPGPLATAILAEAGAEVIKVERPGRGDEMRSYFPRIGPASANFALLNRGKQSLALDLKAPGAIDRLEPLLRSADVLIEQFRPGVMDRLGLGYEQVAALNPGIVYCSVSGYHPESAKSGVAAHDLNYVADAGLLDLAGDGHGDPVVPAVLVADIAGGAYPAVMNIAMALLRRERAGEGAHLRIAMADNVRTVLYWAQADGTAGKAWPARGGALLTGGSPRYAIYRTADDRHLAVAPLEDQFWRVFCEAIELPAPLRDDGADPAATKSAVAAIIGARTAAEWMERLGPIDACCSLVLTPAEAGVGSDAERRVLTPDGTGGIAALPLPVAPGLRAAHAAADLPYPALGADADLIQEDS